MQLETPKVIKMKEGKVNLGKWLHLKALFLLILATTAPAQTQSQIFLKMIGNEASLDAAMIATYLLAQPNKRVFLDTNNDNRIDTIYMIDTHERHGETRQPLRDDLQAGERYIYCPAF
jgi:hypothetical protein